MKKQLWILLNLCAVTLACGERLTPQQLQAAMAANERVTLIDLRPQESYAKGTLPDALRMGVREALEKKLVGKVVFFDDGLSVNRARRAVDTFAGAGKTALELAGGYAAWKSAGFPTSERRGVSDRLERYVTYQDLTGDLIKDAADIVLVDVRDAASAPNRSAMTLQPGEDGAGSVNAATNALTEPLDLAAELPAYRITRQPGDAGSRRSMAGAVLSAPSSGDQPLYILIDSGDGKANAKAAELRSSGCTRVAVLAGGETIIRRKGEAGLIRRGPGTGLFTNKGPGTKNMATISEEVTP